MKTKQFLKKFSVIIALSVMFLSFSSSPALAGSNSLSVEAVLIISGPSQADNVFNGSSVTMDEPVLELVFSQFIDPKTVNSSTITFTDSMGSDVPIIGISSESNRATLSLPQLGPLNYTLNVSGVKDSTDTFTLTGYTLSLKAVIPGSSPQPEYLFSAGAFHTIWVDPYNGVKASGNNDFGQLGDNTTISRSLPVSVKNPYSPSRVLAVSAGGMHSLELTPDQTVMAWGDNSKGQLGIGSNTNSLVPVKVPGLTNIVAISAGYDFSLALKNDGTVYSFGSNQFNQLGDNIAGSRNTPAQIPGLDGIIAIAAGRTHALALRYDGSVYSWGSDNRGELGDGGSASSYKPVKVSSLNNVTAIASGLTHSLALTADKCVYAWGDDSFGQLGDQKTTGYSNVPIKVQEISNPSYIAAGYNSSFVVGSQNATYGFGDNSLNQINSSSAEKLSSPALLNFKAMYKISAGLGHTVADGINGSDVGANVWSWGLNQYGQTGDGLTEHSLTPVKPYLNTEPTFFRLYGADRYKTAVSVSTEGWDYGANTVVLARADDFPDALAGTPLSYALDAPILLTDSNQLSVDTKNEIDRLAPDNIIILGGEGAISNVIEDNLKKDYMVTRLGGQDRYGTAAAIAQYMKDNNLISGNKAVIAYGENFPDALAISSAAAHAHMPILLTDKDVLPDSTSQELQALGITQTIIVGGTGVVGTTVESSLPAPTRFSGSDRYATAIAIARGMGVDTNLVYLATGNNFPDALAGSVLAARTNSPIILVDSSLSVDSGSWLKDNSQDVKEFYVLGGSGVVADSILQSVYNKISN